MRSSASSPRTVCVALWSVLFQVNDDGLLSCLAAEISAWFGHPRPTADTTQPEELPGTWSDGAMVRKPQNERNYYLHKLIYSI